MAMMGEKPGILFTKYRLLEHIHDQQLPHFCLIVTGDESQPLHLHLRAIHQQIHSNAVTHRLARCSTISSIEKLLQHYGGLHLGSGSQTHLGPGSTYYLAICAPVDYQPGLTNIVRSLFEKGPFNIQVMYLFVNYGPHKIPSIDQLEGIAVERTGNIITYELKARGKIKQLFCLQQQLSEMAAVAFINSYLQSSIIQQHTQIRSNERTFCPILPVLLTTKFDQLNQCLQMLAQKIHNQSETTCIFEQSLECFLELMSCFYNPTHPILAHLKHQFQEGQCSVESISEILCSPEILNVVSVVMSASTHPAAVGYVSFVYREFHHYRQALSLIEHQNEEYVVHLSLLQAQAFKILLHTHTMVITSSWVVLTSDDSNSVGNILLTFQIKLTQQNKQYITKCKPAKSGHARLLIWPLSVFRIQEKGGRIYGEWVGNWKDESVRSISKMPREIPAQKNYFSKKRIKNYEMTNRAPRLKRQEISYNLLKRLQAIPAGYQREIIKWQTLRQLGCAWKRVGKHQASIACYRQAWRLLKQIKQYARQSQSGTYGEGTFDYFVVAMELAEQHIMVDCPHQSLAVLEQCLMQLPIFYNFESTMSKMGEKILSGGLSQIDIISIRIMNLYIRSFGQAGCFEIASQYMEHMLRAFEKKVVYVQLHREVMVTHFHLAKGRLISSKLGQIQKLEELVYLLSQILVMFEGTTQESIEVELKLVECRYLLGHYAECRAILNKYTDLSSTLSASNLFGIQCKLKILACDAKEQKIQQCAQQYQRIIQDLDEMALSWSEDADASNDSTHRFFSLTRQVHAGYSRLLNQLGRPEESFAAYEQYLSKGEGFIDYYSFIAT